MTVYDGTDGFKGQTVSGDRLDKTVLYHSSSLPTAGTNDIPVNGQIMVDGAIYENTGTKASPKWAGKTAGAELFGDGSDGSATLSSNTDLGSSNTKQYTTLTINSGIVLEGNSGMEIRVNDTLTFGSSTSTIHVNGKGGAAGAAVTVGNSTSGAGGAGGGTVYVFAATVSGSGKIQANGIDGSDATVGVWNTTNDQSGNSGVQGTNPFGFTDPAQSTPPNQFSIDKAGGLNDVNIIQFNSKNGTASGGGSGGVQHGTDPDVRSGGGAGGGGGVVWLKTDSSCSLTLEATGGDGGEPDATNLSIPGTDGSDGGTVVIDILGTETTTIDVTGGAGSTGLNGGANGSAGTTGDKKMGVIQ